MELQVRNVTWKSRKVKEIYLASFPKKERMPFWTMLLLSKMDSTKFWEFSDGERSADSLMLPQFKTLFL